MGHKEEEKRQDTDIFTIDERLKALKQDEAKIDESIREYETKLWSKGGPLKDNPAFARIQSFGVRLVYGIIYVLLILAASAYSPKSLAFLLAIFSAINAFEFYRMTRVKGSVQSYLIGIPAAFLFPFSALLGVYGLSLVILILMIALCTWFIIDLRTRIIDIAFTFFGACYTGLMLSSMVFIRDSASVFETSYAYGMAFTPNMIAALLTLGVFASVWANDSLAYVFGSLFGKHKMVPKISPKKSWEGFWAGIAASVLVWYAMTFIPGLNLPVYLALFAGFVCGCVGVIGDLVESRIKRSCGVKDSGTFIPGHGGMLDRTDSVIMVASTAFFILALGMVI